MVLGPRQIEFGPLDGREDIGHDGVWYCRDIKYIFVTQGEFLSSERYRLTDFSRLLNR